LARLCTNKTGLTFAAKIYLKGQCEGRTVLYEKDKYPFKCIGPVRFFWRPIENEQDMAIESSNLRRSLWIWSHPSIYKSVEQQLINTFVLEKEVSISQNLVSNNHDNQQSNIQEKSSELEPPKTKKRKLANSSEQKPKEIEKTQYESKEKRSLVYKSNDETGIHLRSLKDKLNRFKLLGPLSTTILANVLNPIKSSSNKFAYIIEKNIIHLNLISILFN
jgi:hypothetical protein